jgi:hypothetical protein
VQTKKQLPLIYEITVCPVDSAGNTIKQDVALELTGIDPSLNDKINRWESVNGGVTWSTATGTTKMSTTVNLVHVACEL